jgi:hypothetical protein
MLMQAQLFYSPINISSFSPLKILSKYFYHRSERLTAQLFAVANSVQRSGVNYLPECHGGVGFPNLSLFNLASFGKQDWQIFYKF